MSTNLKIPVSYIDCFTDPMMEEDEEMNRKEYGRRRRIALSKRRQTSVNDSRYQTSPRMISRMVPEGFDMDE